MNASMRCQLLMMLVFYAAVGSLDPIAYHATSACLLAPAATRRTYLRPLQERLAHGGSGQRATHSDRLIY